MRVKLAGCPSDHQHSTEVIKGNPNKALTAPVLACVGFGSSMWFCLKASGTPPCKTTSSSQSQLYVKTTNAMADFDRFRNLDTNHFQQGQAAGFEQRVKLKQFPEHHRAQISWWPKRLLTARCQRICYLTTVSIRVTALFLQESFAAFGYMRQMIRSDGEFA